MVYIVMGVSGSGKTIVGGLLAEGLGLPFHDGDDFHSVGNVEKMRRGEPLTEEDRVPWLFDLALHIARWNLRGGAVLACSALKERYRGMLGWNGNEAVTFVYLRGDAGLIRRRMEAREGHFFPPGLLESQFADLEEPRDAVTVSIDGGPVEICGRIIEALERRGMRRHHEVEGEGCPDR